MFGTAGRSESTTYLTTRAIAMIHDAPQRDPDSVLMTILVHALYEVMQGFSAQRIHEHEMFVRPLRNFERESHFERERLQPQPL